MPDLQPEPRQPIPPQAKLSLADLESAEHLLDPQPEGEAESETDFAQKLQNAIKAARNITGIVTQSETLKAMEK